MGQSIKNNIQLKKCGRNMIKEPRVKTLAGFKDLLPQPAKEKSENDYE
jgi:hypothetical protein